MPDRAWEELVAEGRSLDKKEGELRFAWGDWALKVAPMGTGTANNGRTERLQEAMAEAGVSVSLGTLIDYRRTAHAWPLGARTPSASWSVHNELMPRGDRFDLIRPGMTVDEARRLVGRPAHRPSDAAGKAAVVRSYLADPEVKDALRADTKALAAMSGVLNEHAKDTEARSESISARDPVIRKIDERTAALDFVEVCDRFVRGMEDALRRVGPLTEHDRSWMDNALIRASVAMECARTFLQSGSTDFDEGLAQLLREAGGNG